MRVGTGYLGCSRRTPRTSAADPRVAPGRDRRRPFPIRRCIPKRASSPKPQVRASAVVSDRQRLDSGRDPARRLLTLSPVQSNRPTADPLARDRDLAGREVRRAARNAWRSAAPRAATQVSAEFSSLDPVGSSVGNHTQRQVSLMLPSGGRFVSRRLVRPPAAPPSPACTRSLTTTNRESAGACRVGYWPAFRDRLQNSIAPEGQFQAQAVVRPVPAPD